MAAFVGAPQAPAAAAWRGGAAPSSGRSALAGTRAEGLLRSDRSSARRVEGARLGAGEALVGACAALGVVRWAGGARRQHRRRPGVAVRGSGSTIDKALEVGRNADRERRSMAVGLSGNSSRQARQLSRVREVKRKIDILKGYKSKGQSVADEYRDKIDKAMLREQNPDDEIQDDSEKNSEKEGEGGERLPIMEQLYGASAGQKSWQFKREMSFETEERESVPVSDDARAVASAELAGEGNSSARSIIDAAREYSIRELDHLKAAELLEIARKRIDRDQIQRKIDLEESQKLDEECMFLLAESYDKGGRLTLSFNTYSILKERLRNTSKARMAQFAWAGVAYKLGEALYGVRRFQEAFDIFEMIHGGCDKNRRLVIGNDLFEDAMMQSGMTLQQLKRLEEAGFYFKEVRRSTQSATRKAQAQFCADVMEAQQTFPDQRLDAAHEIWEQNFVLPRDSYSGAQVTWPFAIPVVSIAKRSGFEGFFV